VSEDPIRDRLRRQLARRAKNPPPAEIEPDPALRRGVFESLARHARVGGEDALARSAGDVILPPVGGFSRVRELSLDPPRDLARSERGVASRTRSFARDHRHGTENLDSVFDVARDVLAERARDERLAHVDLSRALYFDTETTGLSGGAGTYVFLVGLMRFDGQGFDLWQGFLPHPSEEKCLLEEVAQRIADASVLVSFFGKSFDRHRLEDKMRLHGVTPPFADTVHLDLYHPLRRAHRGRFENCRLKTLERELVGFARPDDLPGSFAPAAWFDFLGGRPHRLEGVFQHNADDVLSLAALLCHLAR
jgi:uncharacterized protein YprB with RNaseH-like and TPR domain